MSKLQALKTLAAQRHSDQPGSGQPRDAYGRWSSQVGQAIHEKIQGAADNLAAKGVKGVAGDLAVKGAVLGAGALGHHAGGEAGAVAAMLAARTAVSLGKHLYDQQTMRHSVRIDELADLVETDGQKDVIGHFVSTAVQHGMGAIADAVIPHAGQGLGAVASAAITPQLAKVAKRLKDKLREQPNVNTLRMAND